MANVLRGGNAASNRQRFPEPTVGGFILNPKGELLLCRSWKWFGKWTLPGGHVELGERVEDALKRELREEVGLKVEPVRLLLVQDAIYPKSFHRRRHFVFLDYLCESNSSDVAVDGKEIDDFVWVKPEKALTMPLEPFTRRLVRHYLKEGR